jgi:4-amino-4-deoxy-L-arabinose transferase-like glycosyltransferase
VTTTFNDDQLAQLAARRQKELFPILDRSTSLSPLLVVLTFLPGIIALESSSIDELDAQWRLKSLQLATAQGIAEIIDPSGISQSNLKWQPPLVSWLGAAAVHLPGPLGSHGLELVDYLTAAGLVPATYFLVARLFGRRIGFVAAVLVGFHTTFLEEFQNATPHALAMLAALVTFWGFLGHLRYGGQLVSIDLLVGGISLGLCLLAGGPLAFVVVAVLLVVVLTKAEPAPEMRRTSSTRRGRWWSGWPALRSLGVLVATAFAAGGWWELMMFFSYGRQFVVGWSWGIGSSPAGASGTTLHLFSGAFGLRFVQEYFAMTRVLAGFTFLGLWTVARGLVSLDCKAKRTKLVFVAAWFLCGLGAFAAGLLVAPAGSLYFNMWRLFLMSSCVACSALALDEIAHRRIGLSTFVTVTLGSLFVGYVFLHPKTVNNAPNLWLLLGGLALAFAVGQLMRRICERSESRQWLVFAGLIFAYLAADASIGVWSIRADDQSRVDWRALSTFHNSLPPHNDTGSCLLISDTKVPYRLLLALKSVWPRAEITVVPDWDQALKIALDENQVPKTAIVVDWSEGTSRPANPTGAQWETVTVGNPQYFEQRQLRAYVLKSEHKTTDDVESGRVIDEG